MDAFLPLAEYIGPLRVKTTGPSPSQNQAGAVGLSPDDVHFSAGGDKVQQLETNLASLPDIRQDRVASLSQAIKQGSYNVSDQEIAQAMCSELSRQT